MGSAGEQALFIHIGHRRAEPVRGAHIGKGQRPLLPRRGGVVALHPQGGVAGADGDLGHGVLPHQIVVPHLHGAARDGLPPGGDVDHRAVVGHLGAALGQDKAGAGGQLKLLALRAVLEGQGAAGLGRRAGLAGLLLIDPVQGLLGAVVGLLELLAARRLPLALGRGEEGPVQVAQGHQTVPPAEGVGPAAQDHGGGQAAQGISQRMLHGVSSSGSSPALSRWEII